MEIYTGLSPIGGGKKLVFTTDSSRTLSQDDLTVTRIHISTLLDRVD